MLLLLLIAVPVGIGLAVLLELLEHRGEHIETWIEDVHPLFAPPTTADTRLPNRHLRLTGDRSKAGRWGPTRTRPSQHRRAA